MLFPQARFVLVGRDGVINRRLVGGFVRSWTEFEFLPRAIEALRLLANHGVQTIIVAREEGVALGLMSTEELHALTSRLLLEVTLSGGRIHQVYSCVGTRESECASRGPLSGLLQQAISEHCIQAGEAHMICDSPGDLEAGNFLGLPGTLVLRNSFLGNDFANPNQLNVASCLYVAVQQLLNGGVAHMRETLSLSWPEPPVTFLA
jgi:D-glycero-D-manno-heptose 1,7-bisphosphate phosphatase